MRIGIVGFGFMGRMHFGCWSRIDGAEVVAVCEAREETLAAARDQIGNIPGLPGHIDMAGVTLYSDLETMLTQESLDTVSLTVPTWLHADLTCGSLQTGVHVLCEKPMALNEPECRRMIAAAEQADRRLMIGHCIRFWPEYDHVRDLIHSGKFGKVLTASFHRFSARPAWSSDNWLINQQRSGGMPLDLHIHDADFIQYVFGMPAAVSGRAVAADGMVEHIQTDYHYDADMLITAEGSWLVSDSFQFRMNFEILLEQATIVYDSMSSPACRIYPTGREPYTPELSPENGYYHEIDYFARLIQGRLSREIITMHQSLDSVRLIEAEIQSLATGAKVNL